MKSDGRWRLKSAAVWYNFNVSEEGVKMRRRETDRTKVNCPRYTLSDKMISPVAEITEVAKHLERNARKKQQIAKLNN